MIGNFGPCDAYLVDQIEGGFVVDNGGPTNYGITVPFLTDYWRSTGKDGSPTEADIRSLTPAVAAVARKALCWDACRCDELPSGVDFAVYDAAINSGDAQAARWLQQNLLVAADGKIGPRTIAAATVVHPVGLINAICLHRMEDMGKFHAWPQAGHGWACRLLKVQAFAAGLAR